MQENNNNRATFNIKDFRQGQDMTVGAINGIPTDIRWMTETKVFTEIILDLLKKDLDEKKSVSILDFGVGVGRLAKPLIENNNKIHIHGIDQAPEMLTFAKEYVNNNDNFTTELDVEFLQNNEDFDFAYCIYCLQHLRSDLVKPVIKKLSEVCPKLLIVNSVTRMALPEFANDGINILNELKQYYNYFEHVIPADLLIKNQVIRKMFLEGSWLHYAFMCYK